jgi:hypothetical protein
MAAIALLKRSSPCSAEQLPPQQLRELADQHGEELLERRFDAWPRVLTAFRAVYGGVRHDDIHVPAYGGRLFDPDRFPFLEGRQSGTT